MLKILQYIFEITGISDKGMVQHCSPLNPFLRERYQSSEFHFKITIFKKHITRYPHSCLRAFIQEDEIHFHCGVRTA